MDFLLVTMTLLTLVVAYITVYYMANIKMFSFIKSRHARTGCIDGLRGYLALGVFIHHFVITWFWKNTGLWERPAENYVNNFGKVGVAIFFIITGFLFINKLLNDNGKTNWYNLYISRIFRIYPLYLVALAMVYFVSFYKTDFQINSDIVVYIKQLVRWLLYNGSTINDFNDSELMLAEVYWTLKYEWLFYLFLPVISFFMQKTRSFIAILIISVFCIALFIFPQYLFSINTRYFLLFIIGGWIALLSKSKSINLSFFKSTAWSVIAFTSLLLSLLFPTFMSFGQVFFITVFFIPIAMGNNMFGLFSSLPSIILGEISYSIYLLHGLILYFLFSLTSLVDLTVISFSYYLMVMPVVACLVIIISSFTFLLIERKSIKIGRYFEM